MGKEVILVGKCCIRPIIEFFNILKILRAEMNPEEFPLYVDQTHKGRCIYLFNNLPNLKQLPWKLAWTRICFDFFIKSSHWHLIFHIFSCWYFAIQIFPANAMRKIILIVCCICMYLFIFVFSFYLVIRHGQEEREIIIFFCHFRVRCMSSTFSLRNKHCISPSFLKEYPVQRKGR